MQAHATHTIADEINGFSSVCPTALDTAHTSKHTNLISPHLTSPLLQACLRRSRVIQESS